MDDEQMLLADDNPTVVQQPFPTASHPPVQQYPPPYGQQYRSPAPEVAMAPMASSGQFTHNTTVVINQPSVPAISGPRDWTTTLCSCCDDMGSCLLGTFCPFVLACQISMEMEESMCVPCCVPGWLIVLRTKMRTENNIQGTVMDDCCTSVCCGNCVMCQMARELKYIRRSYRPAQ